MNLCRPISTIQELKHEISQLWIDINNSCRNCSDPDCVGYIWVMPEEESELLDTGTQLIQINGNDGPIFIDSYQRDTHGCVIVSQSKPSCPHLSREGICLIHAKRPLACHLYPLGPDMTKDGRLVLGLHTDCQHIRSLTQQNRLQQTIQEAKDILSRIDKPLITKLLNYWTKVEYISIRPNGENNFIEIMEI